MLAPLNAAKKSRRGSDAHVKMTIMQHTAALHHNRHDARICRAVSAAFRPTTIPYVTGAAATDPEHRGGHGADKDDFATTGLCQPLQSVREACAAAATALEDGFRQLPQQENYEHKGERVHEEEN